MFRGLDEVPGKVPPFIRSIPIEKALDSDTLIATHMNGRTADAASWVPCPRARTRLDRCASCKWLTEIKILESNSSAIS